MKVTQLCLTLGLYSPWNSPGHNSGVGSCSLLQGIFPTQEWNPGSPYCRWILYQLRHKGSLYIWIVLITEHDFIMKTTDCSIFFYLTQSYFKDGSGRCSTFCWLPQRTNSQNKQTILKWRRDCLNHSCITVQLLSSVRLSATQWTATRQASLSFTISQSFLKLISTESVMLSNHLIPCHPLLTFMLFKI